MTSAVQILNGSQIAAKGLSEISKKIEKLRGSGEALCLATVQVGNSKDAALYLKTLENLLKKLGIDHLSSISLEKISETELCAKVSELNEDASVSGILIFSPLPTHLDNARVLASLSQLKDVEGRTFLKSHFGVFSPTANAVLRLIEETGQDLAGKEAVVVGHSDIVGKPVAVLLMDKLATVTVCHARTRNLREKIENAEIVVAAAGKPNLIRGDWIRPGAIVIDVGENVVDGRLVGDVEFDAAKTRAAFISPVPGGVGPLTNVILLENLLKLHSLRQSYNGNH